MEPSHKTVAQWEVCGAWDPIKRVWEKPNNNFPQTPSVHFVSHFKGPQAPRAGPKGQAKTCARRLRATVPRAWSVNPWPRALISIITTDTNCKGVMAKDSAVPRV